MACLALCFPAAGHAEIVINELMAAASARLLQYDANGVPQVGTGPKWYQAAFNDASWLSGPGPFGYGTLTNNPVAIATKLAKTVERDAHGNVRIAEVNIGEILKSQVQGRLKKFGAKTTIVAKNIGYELRCADPIPFDMEYTRDLGYCATKYLLSGGNAAMVSLQGGHFVPIPFAELLDPKTGKAKIRMVDVHSTRYAIARRYMIRLRRDDFDDPHELAKFAASAGQTLQQFRDEFEYLVRDEPPPLVLDRERNDFVEEGSVRSGEKT